MSEKHISSAVIKRLPRYYRYLGDLLENEVVRISSKELSERMNVTASQIRQDLNNFGGFGQQGYGYNVEHLYKEIAKILGLENEHSVIIIGVGNLGQAIANYHDFKKRGFVLSGLFDVNPDIIGKVVNGVTVKHTDELAEFIKENDIDIAAITVPKEKAPKIALEVSNLGVKAIWNFAPTDLKLPDSVIVENVHLADSLMRVSYSINARNKSKKDD
ncbi:MAG: redox-sensing transcriptional repressor Rex [Lachnospiraceae bacterium]|nr:redox-sensing transcriptional repressor Rex [Lachnospiraceae bacterium]